MSTRRADERHTRTRYGSLIEALEDADRVVGDLVRSPAALFITTDDVDFTARRAQDLIRACIEELNTRGIE